MLATAMLVFGWRPTPLTARSSSRAPPPQCSEVWAQAAGLAVLGSVIVVHEAGHFAAARVQGMRISEFSIGFGPPVLETKQPGGAVRYVLRLLPIGGFVSFPRYLNTSRFIERGMTPPAPREGIEVTDPDDPNLLENRPPLQQAAVISAGVIANLVLAWACLFTSAVTVGVPSLTLGSPLAVSRVLEGSMAAAAGLRSADVLIAIDGCVLLDQPDPLQAASRSIGAATAARRPFTATVERAGERLLLPIAPAAPQPLAPGGEVASREVASRGDKSVLGIELNAQVTSPPPSPSPSH